MNEENKIHKMSLMRRIAVKVKTEALGIKINAELDRIHDEAIAKFRTLAKSTGQRTRTDRLLK